LCVCFAVCFYVFYVYMGQVPEIKLMMMITHIERRRSPFP